ncbi:MAG: hypothetical protein B7X10_06670, partial [Burkholderiales bacterium 21-58-4]
DPTINLVNFYNTIWNITTATGYGLDVWGRIVGVSRYLNVPGTFGFFGFNEAQGSQPFNQAPFYNGTASSTVLTALSDTAYRQIILLKALANITNCSAQQLNAFLTTLYGAEGIVYVIDNLNMTFTYRFKFILSPLDYVILTQSGAVPTPAGVSYTIVQGA